MTRYLLTRYFRFDPQDLADSRSPLAKRDAAVTRFQSPVVLELGSQLGQGCDRLGLVELLDVGVYLQRELDIGVPHDSLRDRRRDLGPAQEGRRRVTEGMNIKSPALRISIRYPGLCKVSFQDLDQFDGNAEYQIEVPPARRTNPRGQLACKVIAQVQPGLFAILGRAGGQDDPGQGTF
jgi:hypothetical protein